MTSLIPQSINLGLVMFTIPFGCRRVIGLLLVCMSSQVLAKKIVIAHRGASGYLPEHTLEAAAMAYGWGVDYIEPDVVLTRDSVPIIMHDIHLDATTDVAQVFPKRGRADGRYYAIDFTLAEIRMLKVRERTNQSGQVVYPNRFPSGSAHFSVPTLDEFIQLIQGLNFSHRRQTGIYPEIKSPQFHLQSGYDITAIVYQKLLSYGYKEPTDPIYIQCFDPRELKRLRYEFGARVRLIQLLSEVDDHVRYSRLVTEKGLKEVASYANGIGPSIRQILEVSAKGAQLSQLVHRAKRLGLEIHGYTLRRDELPPKVPNIDWLHTQLFQEGGVDGMFSDFGDLTLRFLRKAGLDKDD